MRFCNSDLHLKRFGGNVELVAIGLRRLVMCLHLIALEQLLFSLENDIVDGVFVWCWRFKGRSIVTMKGSVNPGLKLALYLLVVEFLGVHKRG
eukprot:2760995-Ditylum_brightwellii.AAC.2